MELSVTTEGVKTQAERLGDLASGAPSVLRAGINANLKVGAKGISAAANVYQGGTRIVNHHYVNPGGLEASIGSRMDRGKISGKAGLGVAKTQSPLGSTVTKSSKTAVSYGHFVIDGTAPRKTGSKRVWKKKSKSYGTKATATLPMNRGAARAFKFVESGYESVKPQADQAGVNAMEKRLLKLEAGQK